MLREAVLTVQLALCRVKTARLILYAVFRFAAGFFSGRSEYCSVWLQVKPTGGIASEALSTQKASLPHTT